MNAEHVAYAINYISSRSCEKVAIVAWPQGNLSTQWSLKYWPGTRDQVSNFICIPADFRGTIDAWGLCPFNGTQPCTPQSGTRRGISILSQRSVPMAVKTADLAVSLTTPG